MTKRHLPTTQCDSTTDRIKDALPVGFMEGHRMKEHTAEGGRWESSRRGWGRDDVDVVNVGHAIIDSSPRLTSWTSGVRMDIHTFVPNEITRSMETQRLPPPSVTDA